MKKIISVVIAAIMMISALATVAVVAASAIEVTDGSVTSAAVSGDWNAYAAAGAYLNDDGTLADYDTIPSNSNIPGIEYTDDGFKAYATYDKDRSGETQRFNIMSTKKVNLKDGVTMTVRVDDFNYSASDMWFSFSIWDSENLSQGDGSGRFGNGYTTLIRPKTTGRGDKINFNGFKTMESYISDQSYYNTAYGLGTSVAPSKFNLFGWGNGTFEYDYILPDTDGETSHWKEENIAEQTNKDESGRAVLTMELTWTEDYGYSLKIGGVSVNPIVLNHYLDGYYNPGANTAEYYNGDARFADGYAYIGFSVHSAASDATASVTVTDFNGVKPTGTDVRNSTCNKETFGAMIDGSTLPETDPVLSITSTSADDYKEVGKFPGTDNLTYTANKDGTFTVKPGLGASWVMLQPKAENSYKITDYPVFAIVLKDYCTCIFAEGENGCKNGEVLDLYLSTGEVLSSSDEYKPQVTQPNHIKSAGDGHDYKVFVVNFDQIASENNWGESWKGWNARIHKIQVVFNYDEALIANEGQNHLSICYAGFFKTTKAANDYTDNYVDNVHECQHSETYIESYDATVTCNVPGYLEGTYCSYCGMWRETVIGEGGSISYEWVATRKTVAAPGHDIVNATCTEAVHCSRCDYTTGKALGHKYETKTDASNHWLECTNEGCGDKKEEAAHEFNAIGYCSACTYQCEHTNTEHKKDAVTCTAAGAEYDLCLNCGYQANKKNILSTGHKYTVVTKKDATCTEDGYSAYRVCIVCQDERGKTVILATGHKFDSYLHDDENHWKKCSKCELEDAENKEAHSGTPCAVCGFGCDHTDVDHYNTPATCIQDGESYDICKNCNTKINIKPIYATGEHTIVAIGEAIEATCTTPGLTAGEKCSECDTVIAEQTEIPALGHTLVEIPALAPTCTTNGHSAGQECSVCGDETVPTVEQEALGHNWVDATCTEAKHCTRCETVDGEALGHNWVDATCTEAKHCTVCNETEGEATGHDYVENEAAEPTCTLRGWAAYKTCSKCSYSELEDNIIPPLGHDWVDATCTEAKHCSRCDETDGIAPGHNYGEDGVCTVCGDKKEVTTQKPNEEKPTTEKPTSSSNKNNSSTSNKKKGCGSVAGLGAIAISAAVALAGAVCIKKKKD